MNVLEFQEAKAKADCSKIISINRTPNDYANMFLNKFVYFFHNSNAIFELILNPASEISVTRIDQLLFTDREVVNSGFFQIVEREKETFGLTNDDTLDNKMKYMTLIMNALYEYVDREIKDTFNEYYNDVEYENMLEIKANYLDVVVATQNYIRTSKRIGNYFYLSNKDFDNPNSKYTSLIASLSKKPDILGDLKTNRFITKIYCNNGLILNDNLQEDIITNILYLANGINIFETSKTLVR